MSLTRTLPRLALLAVAAVWAAPAGATILIRASLESLARTNSTIVVGEVVDAQSYWNAEGTFILTDVRIMTTEVLRGEVEAEQELTATLMGGSVDDFTTLILGGAHLVPGKTYLLFLNEEDLPGAPGVRTVRDHVQGVFEIVKAADGLRAVSQASSHPLRPDAFGMRGAPGGAEGLPLAVVKQSIREAAGTEAGRRVR